MNSIFFAIFVIAAIACVLGGIYGAITSKSGVIGVIANLSIPLWAGSVIYALSLPQYPGWDPREVRMLAVVVVLGIVMAVSNKIDNDKMLNKIKGIKL